VFYSEAWLIVVVVDLVCELDVGGGRGLVCVQARGFSRAGRRILSGESQIRPGSARVRQVAQRREVSGSA